MKEEAFGFIETRGFLGLAGATDAMNKAARVDFVRQEHIGSGFVTTITRGEVGAVRASVAAGEEAARQVGELLHAAVISRLHPQAQALCIEWNYPAQPVAETTALGLVETQGYVPMIVAGDVAAKTADIVLTNYFIIGSGYATIAIRGDVAAVRAAVDTGAAAAGKIGKLIATHVIPRPHLQLEPLFKLGGKSDPLPQAQGVSLGFMETRGLTALIAAADAAVKAANVVLIKHTKIGSGIVSIIMQGDVAAVRAAASAGRAAAEKVGQLLTMNVIPAPHTAVLQSSGGGQAK